MSRFKLEYDKVSGGNIIKDAEQREYACTLEAAFIFLCDMDKQNAEYRRLIKEALEYVEYAERDRYQDTMFSRFLNRPEVKQILEEGE